MRKRIARARRDDRDEYARSHALYLKLLIHSFRSKLRRESKAMVAGDRFDE